MIIVIDSICLICKKELGKKTYKKKLVSPTTGSIVFIDVCSKKCQKKKIKRWGGM